jgi:hypothetical protein
MVPTDDGATPAPIDCPVLEAMRSRFVGSRLFESAAIVQEENLHLRAELSDDYYPGDASVRLEIRWYLSRFEYINGGAVKNLISRVRQ